MVSVDINIGDYLLIEVTTPIYYWRIDFKCLLYQSWRIAQTLKATEFAKAKNILQWDTNVML